MALALRLGLILGGYAVFIGGILTSTALTDESDNALLDESGNALFSSGD